MLFGVFRAKVGSLYKLRTHVSMIDPEPPILDDDTQPRAPLITPIERISDQPVPPENAEHPDDARRGCANPLLILFVIATMLVMFLAIVGLAGVVGYRDGSNDAATHAAVARVVAINTQIPHIQTAVQTGDWQDALLRCTYVGTLQPGDAGITQCIANAQQALSATPTSNPTRTPLPAAVTPMLATTSAALTIALTSTPAAPAPQEWLAHAQEAIRQNDFETAISYLEAIRSTDATFDQQEVTTTLCSTYEKLGSQYDRPETLSKMVIVINKALKMQCRLSVDTWAYTVNAAQLYLDAKGFYDAGSYAQADTDYRKLMSLAATYQDSKTLACQAFSKAGDSSAAKVYNC